MGFQRRFRRALNGERLCLYVALAVGWSVLGGEVHEGEVQRSLQRLAQKKCAATNLAS
jgi:hypothetical protein